MSIAYQVQVKSFNGKSEIFVVEADGIYTAVAKATVDAMLHPALNIGVAEDVEIEGVEEVDRLLAGLDGTKRYRITKGVVPDDASEPTTEVVIYETNSYTEAQARWKAAEIVGNPANEDIGDFGRFLDYRLSGALPATLDEYA